MSTSQPSMDKKGTRNSVWNFNKESERESKTITLDEFMDFMRKFLNRLYPQPGYRVTAMTYMKDAIYMKRETGIAQHRATHLRRLPPPWDKASLLSSSLAARWKRISISSFRNSPRL